MQKIVPHLWFDTNAYEAMNFYTSLFDRSGIIELKRYPENMPIDVFKGMEGKVLTGIFELEGQKFMALDGGPQFKFNPSVSFMVQAQSEAEIDKLWQALSDGGKVLMELTQYPFSHKYGWLEDKYGLSWQLMFTDQDIAQKITPALMFTGKNSGQAEAAINYYTTVFRDSQIGEISRYGAGADPNPPNSINHAVFFLEGQELRAMDSHLDHGFNFSEAISLYVDCTDQAEVDYYWTKLSADPKSEQCGWLKDKYGLSWQIIPREMGKLINDPDPQKSERVIKAMLQMKKIDVSQLRQAYQGS